MEFSIATLLSHFIDDKLVATKLLEKKLGCEDEEDAEKIQIALDALECMGILLKERGKYRRIPESNVVEAKLRCSSKGFCFAIQDEEDAEDIYVRETHLSNAWNGDRVLVRIIKEGTRRRSPEGEVRLILERANPSLLAQVKKQDEEYRAIPLDDRLLFELALQQNGENLEQAVNHLVHVCVLRYPIGEYPPLGIVTRILGSDAEAAADTDIVCCKHDLPQEFADGVKKALTKLPVTFDPAELANRKDWRSLLTFAFVEDMKRDHSPFIETAFTLEKNEAQHWQLGIHITDIAHYIATDSPLDRAARKRGTTVFLGEKVLPLFPEAITQLYSLKVGQDALSISVIITLDKNGQIIEFNIEPTVININHLLTYQQTQGILSNLDKIAPEEEALVERLKQLFFTLSPLVKAQRLQRGSFEIQLEPRSPFQDEGRSGVIVASSTFPIRSLLTELVILAGKSVAEHLSALVVPALYCIQPEPDGEELEDLCKLAINLGLDIKLNPEENISAKDYYNLTQAFSQSFAVRVLNYLLQSTLKSAKYSSHPGGHFGLVYDDCYTHCASPGQRYGDLLIQRILKLIFSEGRDRRTKQTKTGVDLYSSSCHGQITWNVLPPSTQEDLEETLHFLVTHLNDREKIAEDAEKDLDGLKKAEKMKERTGQVFRGLITGVQSYGFFVEIEDLLVEGLVHVSSLKDDWYEYRARHGCLVGRKNRIAYRLGDEVEVEVKSVDYYRQQIDLVTVGGGSTARSDDWDDD
ncbi:ribonuclease R family protein [Aphanothece sacrum]|uniref:VacB and RNase II family 3'-5' exoribonuclease n=1 Tax=Aphanothece sacrum FPU1 TaxID=1920663 RepID=A0A401IBM5_APHSA|nr:ribonuclease R family protein [Aphanothece sacrum]GBF78677.1 VacB and RNase II family 3'-5' exoribonuclease [Aphanothece sacrum FPU1]GBF84966.1 VacB and RNase II family 3'-5' exoribonuclease [Aphanothece sacrum FPU3]